MKYKLLSEPTTNYKANKNIDIGYHTYFLSLAHSNLSGYNVCPMANKLIDPKNNKLSNCSSVCVVYNGFAAIFKSVMKARIRKTKMFYEQRDQFIKLLIKDIQKGIKSSLNKGFIPTFRLNAYSDIKWENVNFTYENKNYKNIFELFSDITFYDYTKIPNRKTPKNYEITYSFWGNEKHLKNELKNGLNVAIVFEKLPKTYLNKKVVNGDKTDLRLNESYNGKNCIIGLKFKGSNAKLQDSILQGFCIAKNNQSLIN